jgi:hypothetical protein
MRLNAGGENIISWAGGLFLLGIGVLAIVKPALIIRWAASPYKGLQLDARNPLSIWLARLLGTCMLGFGLLVLIYA